MVGLTGAVDKLCSKCIGGHHRQCGEQEGETEGTVALASENPRIVMLDQETGNKYMRAVDQKGVGEEGEMRWLVKDMHK